MAASTALLCVLAPNRLHTRRWGDEAVVYDDRTGDTHLLGSFAIEVFGQLMQAPLSRDALLERLGNADAQAVDEVLAKLIELKICAAAS